MTVQDEIKALEEKLIQAELGPDPAFFETYLDDAMVMVSNGEASVPKKKIVEAHHPQSSAKFTRVEMNDIKIVDHGSAAVVTCKGMYEGPQGKHDLKFMRMWVKKTEGWRIVAGTID